MIFPRREQLNAALKRWPLLAEFAEKNKEAGDGYSGITGRARELASRPLRLHSPGPCNCSVKACWRSTPARIICCAFSLIPISIIRTAGRGRCSTAGTGVTRACAIRSISIYCRLASSAPAKRKCRPAAAHPGGDSGGSTAATGPVPLAAAGSAGGLFAVDPRAADALRSLAGGGSSRRQ